MDKVQKLNSNEGRQSLPDFIPTGIWNELVPGWAIKTNLSSIPNQEKGFFFSATRYQLGQTYRTGGTSPMVNRLGRETDYPLSRGNEVNHEWSCTSIAWFLGTRSTIILIGCIICHVNH
jgi:hypothetical protein